METSPEATDHRAEATQDVRSRAAEFPPEIEPALRLLQQYSGIGLEDAPEFISKIQAKASAISPYGCFKSLLFLNLTPTLEDPRYQATVERLRAPGSTETFLDVGCGLGSVVRLLANQGVPGARLYGTDLHAGFLDLGFELFGDRERDRGGRGSRATYVAGDMLDANDARLDLVLRGKIDVIYASAFFHLFEREDQLRAAKRMIGFLWADNPRAMIFGQNQGPKIEGWEKYVLDPGRWAGLWKKWARRRERNGERRWKSTAPTSGITSGLVFIA
ncbi:hypothetical protein PG994_000988 [Apiospora phragmitis]|uniref:Methyltransferase type 12 domain-containing protein n=1 Tax=Apiospora phragmitis TaxID=2905665 RepID=A0ABR1WSD3_9PEZI